jgi:hypothetical protein
MIQRHRVDDATRVSILAAVRSGLSNCQVARDFNVGETTVRRIKAANPQTPQTPLVEFKNKKVGGFNWRDSIPLIKGMQKLRRDASWSQQFATIHVGDGSGPVAIMMLSDTHIGAMGTDYDLFVELTNIILDTPHLYFALIGDEVEWAIRLRSVAEVCAQVLDPAMQLEFLESWLEEVMSKMIFATWSNHSTDRSEQMIGACPVKNILAKKVPFFSGIGHAEIVVGKEKYLIAASHRFKGVTQADCTAGCKRYLRLEWPQGEIAIQGDSHRSGVSVYNEGNRSLIALSSGTLNVNSGYATRNFSIYTSSAFPVLVLFPDEHVAIPYHNIDQYLKVHGLSGKH